MLPSAEIVVLAPLSCGWPHISVDVFVIIFIALSMGGLLGSLAPADNESSSKKIDVIPLLSFIFGSCFLFGLSQNVIFRSLNRGGRYYPPQIFK